MSDKRTPSEDNPEANKPSSSTDKPFSGLANRFLWADSTSSVERLIFWLGMLCALLFVLDFIVHRHSYAPGEGLPGFYAVVGFVAFTLIVLGAKQLRRLILRNEDYYSPNSVDAEQYPQSGLDEQKHGFESQASESANNASAGFDKNDSSLNKSGDRGDSA